MILYLFFFFFSSRRRHTRCSRDWSSDVCSSDLHGCCPSRCRSTADGAAVRSRPGAAAPGPGLSLRTDRPGKRSEEHTSELQSRLHLVCRLLLEKKKDIYSTDQLHITSTISMY